MVRQHQKGPAQPAQNLPPMALPALPGRAAPAPQSVQGTPPSASRQRTGPKSRARFTEEEDAALLEALRREPKPEKITEWFKEFAQKVRVRFPSCCSLLILRSIRLIAGRPGTTITRRSSCLEGGTQSRPKLNHLQCKGQTLHRQLDEVRPHLHPPKHQLLPLLPYETRLLLHQPMPSPRRSICQRMKRSQAKKLMMPRGRIFSTI